MTLVTAVRPQPDALRALDSTEYVPAAMSVKVTGLALTVRVAMVVRPLFTVT